MKRSTARAGGTWCWWGRRGDLHRRVEERGPHVRPQIHLEQRAAARRRLVQHELQPEHAVTQVERRGRIEHHEFTRLLLLRTEHCGPLPHRDAVGLSGVRRDRQLESAERDPQDGAAADNRLGEDLCAWGDAAGVRRVNGACE